MDLSIIIVNYNTAAKAMNCLRSIYATANPFDFEVILVDNNSTEPLDNLLATFPQITLIRNDKNLGMGAGNNVGIRQASGEYVLILNADTEFIGSGMADLLDFIKHNPDVGIVGPKLIYPDGERQISCYRFPSLLMPIYRRTFLGKLNAQYLDDYLYQRSNLDEPLEVDWIMGSCLLLSRELLNKLGGFDERFFMYFEDTDLCRRIKQLGLKAIYNPTVTVKHYHGRASAKEHWSISIFTNKMTRIHLLSWLKYFWKWKFSFN